MGMYGAYGAPLGGLVSINGEAAFSESSMASLSQDAEMMRRCSPAVAVVYTQVQTTVHPIGCLAPYRGLLGYPQPSGGTHPPNPRGGELGIARSD